MKKKIKIICTLGPSSLNSEFLEYSQKNVDLLRLNMSHLGLDDLKKNILFIKKKQIVLYALIPKVLKLGVNLLKENS